jgi:hypothetical protein
VLYSFEKATKGVTGDDFGKAAVVLKTFDALRDDVSAVFLPERSDTPDESELKHKVSVGWEKFLKGCWERKMNHSLW